VGIFKGLHQGDIFKDKNEEESIKYFEAIILGHMVNNESA
jgi:hypothetical protein